MSAWELKNNRRRERYATDPEFRSRCLRATRSSRLQKHHGITLQAFEARLAAQHGACAFCNDKLGRFIRVDHKAKCGIGLICVRCSRRVGILRYILKHAKGFGPYLDEWGVPRPCPAMPARRKTGEPRA